MAIPFRGASSLRSRVSVQTEVPRLQRYPLGSGTVRAGPGPTEWKGAGMASPGTWHESQPTKKVDWTEATNAWAEATLPELEQIASVFGGSITYEDLAAAIQERTGYRTKMLLANWIGQVLEVVLRRTLREGLPPLTALVVRKETGGVGDGYYNRNHPQGTISDKALLQRIAAEDRLACYRAYAPSVPEDAVPKMTDLYVQRHSLMGKPKIERPEHVCPTCHLVLPLSGRCDTCD